MGSKGDGRSAEEKRLDEEARRLQNEQLKREKELSERQKKEKEAMLKAQRAGGGTSLIGDSESTGSSSYGSLLGE